MEVSMQKHINSKQSELKALTNSNSNLSPFDEEIEWFVFLGPLLEISIAQQNSLINPKIGKILP